jgi:hypothetical protein
VPYRWLNNPALSGRVRAVLLLDGTSYPDGGVYAIAGQQGDGPLGLGPAPASASNLGVRLLRPGRPEEAGRSLRAGPRAAGG